MKKLILITLLLVTSLCASELKWVGGCENEMAYGLATFGGYIDPEAPTYDMASIKQVMHEIMLDKEQQKKIMATLNKEYNEFLKLNKNNNRARICEIAKITKEELLNMSKTKQDIINGARVIYFSITICYCTIGGDR